MYIITVSYHRKILHRYKCKEYIDVLKYLGSIILLKYGVIRVYSNSVEE